MRSSLLFITLIAPILASCGGGSSGDGDFRLIEFLESGQAAIPRNRSLTFKFSAPVAQAQDFAERLKIQNVQGTSFARAIGVYVVVGEQVRFDPRLPEVADRGDAGFRANANYVVYLKGGPDALTSEGGNQLVSQQEFGFNTSEFFEDPDPQSPPRALGIVARDINTNQTYDVSRLDPRPAQLAALDSNDLITSNRFIEPGAGVAPTYATPWRFDLMLSEPIDPATVTTSNVEMYEVYSNATQTDEVSPPAAAPGHYGDPVAFKVPINVEVVQGLTTQGTIEYKVRVVPIFTLVDNTRYRITFSGSILGLDFRKTFAGDNGLTGDGETQVAGAGEPFPEPGGLGYTTEFIVRNRPAISQVRTLTYDPLVDGINPELGQTETDETLFNSALYNPATSPSTAVGFLSAFGQGTDGDLAVASGGTFTIDTGDTPNDDLGNPFQVLDLNPNDDYLGNPLPGGLVTYDSPMPFELQLQSLTVSTSGTLQVIGVNPIWFRVQGIAQINGIVDVSGGDGQAGGGAVGTAGAGGPSGFAGGSTTWGANTCTISGSCTDFSVYLQQCAAANNTFPHTTNGFGPGRGYAGGETYVYDYNNDLNEHGGTGGGGGSHATKGQAGEDRKNVGGSIGTPGPSCSTTGGKRNAGVIGVRGQSGPVYGDREIEDVILGGSGGGGGGSISVWSGPKNQAGGAGGGGGGAVAIIAAGPIVASGGKIDASGGDGGRGQIATQSAPNNWHSTSGGGGGGAGGAITLISGAGISLSGATLDASGGAGGVRGDVGSNLSCSACNAGGDGGNGFIFLMDSDGTIDGFIPGTPGEYDTFGTGVLTISEFTATRFSSIAAITELFNVLSANPDYTPLSPGDVLAVVNNTGQRIRVLVSSAKGNPDAPLLPDISTEIAMFEVALVRFETGSVVVEPTGDMNDLNPAGQVPARDAFVRVRANFEYDDGVEAALGPFASIDRFDISFEFNG
jgi:hypothetical protein